MQAGGREIHVPGDKVPLLDQKPRHDMLGGAPLVSRHYILVSIYVPDSLFQVVEVSAAGISLIAKLEGGPLGIAHGVGAAVREQIDIDVLAFQKKCIIAGFPYCYLTVASGCHPDRLYRLDAKWFGNVFHFNSFSVHLSEHVASFSKFTIKSWGSN
jgi:hypothetical protein